MRSVAGGRSLSDSAVGGIVSKGAFHAHHLVLKYAYMPIDLKNNPLTKIASMKRDKKRSRKSGLAPGTMVLVGEKKAENMRISVIDFDTAHITEKKINMLEELLPFRDSATTTWINIDFIHELNIIEKLGEYYNIHPLVLEDIVSTNQRPKMEDYTNYLFVVLKMLHISKSNGEVVTEQVSLILGKNYVISFQEEEEGDVFDPIRDRLRHNKGRIRELGPDYLFYSLIDAIVDNYFVIMEGFEERIEEMEETLVTNPTTKTLRDIHGMKRELIMLRKSIWPLREVISALVRGDSELITDSTKIYLRDVYDHTIQVIDVIETYRDILSGVMDIYLSTISNRLNEIMKVLTVFMAVFAPLTFLAGVYGMNFKYMPEIYWTYGYPMAWGVMILIAVVMLIMFKRRKWW
ncbi:MAG: magnesium/cobalt transporter CorA [bacterium]